MRAFDQFISKNNDLFEENLVKKWKVVPDYVHVFYKLMNKEADRHEWCDFA